MNRKERMLVMSRYWRLVVHLILLMIRSEPISISLQALKVRMIRRSVMRMDRLMHLKIEMSVSRSNSFRKVYRVLKIYNGI